jgi:hypothetical protein
LGTQPRLSKLVERMTVENDLWKEGVGDISRRRTN